MLKIGRDHLICVVILINSVETWKREKKYMESGTDLLRCWDDHDFQSFDSWDRNTFRNKNNPNPLLEIHEPCFHAFLVLINPVWCLEGFKINYSLQNWQTTLRTPEHLLDFSSVSVSTAQDDREVFERGHSWNVNTQKESSIRQSPGLCHASIFHFSFFVCILVRQTEDGTLQLYCYLLWSPVLSIPVVSPCRVTSLGNASVISTQTMTHPFFSPAV